MKKYDPAKIEKKWQKEWEKIDLYRTPDQTEGRENYYALVEFPYPSGNLHIGHWYSFAVPDTLVRYLRMTGKNVMYPIGFDAFGLPAENAAIKNQLQPRDWTEKNISYMTKQLQSMGAAFDWSRQVQTIDPDYYRWTQWIFLQFYKKGLAYRDVAVVNWCPKDKTVLANEQVVEKDGKNVCDRCGAEVEQKKMEQWLYRITDYADRLVDDLDGLDWPEATKLAQKHWIGRQEEGGVRSYRLHDWVISRQRYWGVPIPMVHCDACGYQPVPEDQLPVLLPKLDDYLPSDDLPAGRQVAASPLRKATEWLKVKCPKCGGEAERETDTMDTFVDSSWYFIRYTDPKNGEAIAGTSRMDQWLPVDLYIGGAEHNTMHLLYSRFFTKALHDLGVIDFDEPFLKRRNHGIILGPDGHKMSKSKGNVIDPDALVEEYGADTVRMYLAFMAPYDQGGPWDPKGINGVARFLQRVWYLQERLDRNVAQSEALRRTCHKAIRNIEEDVKDLKFNTGVSELMKLLNSIEEHETIDIETFKTLLLLVAPFAPHIADELWRECLGGQESIHSQSWPAYDPALVIDEFIDVIVQVNGKVRGTVQVAHGASEDEVKHAALADEKIKKHLEGQDVEKTIFVEDKLINFVF